MTGGQVVILGATGRNVAAGMSGGVAYVLDLDPALVNGELVELEPLAEADVESVRRLVERHAEETGSTVAEKLLVEWAQSVERFTKIMPRDYKRVLIAKEAAEREGRDVITAIMEAAHG